MSDYFPPDLLFEILIRLPAKSLCRFTSVSRSWYSLITSPAFVSSQLDQSKNNPLLLLRRYNKIDTNEYYSIYPESHNRTEPLGIPSLELTPPVKSQLGYFRIVGNCNGLICWSDDYFHSKEITVLWNPSIQKFVTLPMSGINPPAPHMFVLGFGFDMLGKDYKVVRLVYSKDEFLICKILPEVEIYSLKARAWRRIINAGVLCNVMQFMWSHAFVNGCSNWISYKGVANQSLILSFDMCDEVFREIELPDVLSREFASNLVVSELKESVVAVQYGKSDLSGHCCVWMMKEYGVSESWTNLYYIDLGSWMDRFVGFGRDGQVLLLGAGDEFVLHDPEHRSMIESGILGTARSLYANKYVESLVLLEAKHDFS